MSNIYLQVDYATGNIFQFSKEKKEGYDSHTNSKGVETFRKVYQKGLYGTYKNTSVRDSNFGKEVSITVEDKDKNTVYLNLPLFDQRKNLAAYAESFITFLPALNKGTDYRFFAYNIKNEGDKYSKTGISVLPADIQNETVDKDNAPKKLTYTYTKEGQEVKGDIPAVVWEEDFDGSRSMNAKAKNKYLYDILTQYTSDNPPAPQTEQPKPQESKSAPQPVVQDDLPF